MKKYFFLYCFLFFLIGNSTEIRATEKNNKRPNFVFLLADDCTHWDIGCYGSKDSKTPNIDKLAKQGIKFNRCYQAAPMCSPTRHNIYTGLYPVKSGAYPNHTRAIKGTKSIVQHLTPLGYRVAQSGKRHISPETIFSFQYLGKDKNPDFKRVDDFLSESKKSEEPFALLLCSNEPHTPWDKGDAGMFNPETISLPPHFVDTKETRDAYCSYLAEINYLDSQLGNTLDLLEKHDLDKNTLVIFASEQGNSFPFAKWTLYEAGVKSALIARLPGTIKANSESDAIVEYTDLLPTFIEMAGGQKVKSLDGKSLVPIFKNTNSKIKKYSFSLHTTRGINSGSEFYGIRAIVNENYRYILNLTPEEEFKNAVNNSPELNPWFQSWVDKAETDIKAKELILKYRKRPAEELYNVHTDKWCLTNLADNPEFDEIKKELKVALENWMEECGDKGQQTEMKALLNMPRHIKKMKQK